MTTPCDTGISTKEPLRDTAFDGLSISSTLVLETLERTKCPKCGQRKKYFCQGCRVALSSHPVVSLPIPADIIMHQNERPGKATGLHATILAKEDVRLFLFPNKETEFGSIPEYTDEDGAVLLYPSDDAVPIQALELDKVHRVVFVDSTWQQSKAILRDPRLSKLRRVRIQEVNTRFWRHQNFGPKYLATIEAIYTFYKEFVSHQRDGNHDNSMDNLLWYFKFMHDDIQRRYRSKKKPFTRAMIRDPERGSYILYENKSEAPQVEEVPVDELPKAMRARVQRIREANTSTGESTEIETKVQDLVNK